MAGYAVLLVVQSKIDEWIVNSPNKNVPSVHVSVLKLQRLRDRDMTERRGVGDMI